jgi:hypothetical protein
MGPGLSGYMAQSQSEAIALHRAKEFVMKEVIETNTEGVEFYLEPLHAATSGELTTLKFKCKAQNKSGLILAFYGDFWLESGVHFKGYSFKYMPDSEALVFLNTLIECVARHESFVKEGGYGNNNVALIIGDIGVHFSKPPDTAVRFRGHLKIVDA